MNYIFPNSKEKICILQYKNEINNIVECEKIPNNSDFYTKIMNQLQLPFHQSVIKLSQCTRNLMNDKDGPNALLISKNEGGYAKQGLNIIDNDTSIVYNKLNYVDLVVEEDYIEQCIDIYSHELGHVMLANIFSKLPDSISSKQHVSMGITDYFMAFDEGWAEHFERLAYDEIKKYREIHNIIYRYDNDIHKLWQCRADSELRLDGVLDNKYIYQKLLPENNNLNLDITDLIILEHTSTIFDKTKLKNAQQMLSCEGVIATLFYRINTNNILKSNYQSKEFYNNFLLKDLTDNSQIKKLFTPFENIILKSFWVFSKIKDNLSAKSIPIIEYIKTWCDCFPEDKTEILKIFIHTTIGKTISNELSDLFEQTSYNGMIGNIKTYTKNVKQYQGMFNKVLDKVKNNKISIDKNIGSEIWIENKDVKIPKYFWLNNEKTSLRININTASFYDLISFNKITKEVASNIIKKRTHLGFFKSLHESGIDKYL